MDLGNKMLVIELEHLKKKKRERERFNKMQCRLVFAKYNKPVRDSSLSLQNLNTNVFQMFEKYKPS